MRPATLRPMGAHRGGLRVVRDHEEQPELTTGDCGKGLDGVPIDRVAAAIMAVVFALGGAAWVIAIGWLVR